MNPTPKFSVKSTSKKPKPVLTVVEINTITPREDIRVSYVVPDDLFNRSLNKDFD